MAALPWPPILVPSSEQWNLNKGASRSGGRSVVNQEQVVVGPTGYVAATLTVPCNTDAKIMAMRALLAGLDGRAGQLIVGPLEGRRAPWVSDPLTGNPITPGVQKRALADDAGYAGNPDVTATLSFALAADLAANAVSLTVTRARGGMLAIGQIFSIGNRLHLVTAMPFGDAGGSTVAIGFRPWARAASATGTAVEFAAPVGTMRLASDDTGAIELQLSRTGTVSLDLIEAF